MFNNIGTTEILVIVLVLVVIFGGSKISEVAKGLGEATKEFKKAQREVDETKKELKKEPVLDKDDKPEVPVASPEKKKIRHLKKKKK
jgi:sec-independent protein translocase protein TatA